jgi:hypothetical protein
MILAHSCSRPFHLDSAKPNDDLALVCLETSLNLGMVPAQSSKYFHLHLLAIKEGLLELPNIFLVDTISNSAYRLLSNPRCFAAARSVQTP